MHHRDLLKISQQIATQLHELRCNRQKNAIERIGGIVEQIDNLRQSQSRLKICLNNQWDLAAQNILESIPAFTESIPYHLGQIDHLAKQAQETPLSLRDIYLELLQTKEEFDGLIYRKDESLLVVETEPIQLDDIYLGPFEIQLHIPSLSQLQYYDKFFIHALEPHPASSNELVTHPHVNDEHLCAGDAEVTISAALSTGRICDFFHLVIAVLNNYNPSSPFISLENWSGISCYSCDYLMGDDEPYWCMECNNNFCSECVSCCNVCDDTYCRGCLSECQACQNWVCSQCSSKCPNCGRVICKTCLEENQCLCTEEEQENEQSKPTTTQAA